MHEHTCTQNALSVIQTIHMHPCTMTGVEYNIPVALWLHPTYPNTYPLVYVTPTPEMVIHPHCKCVNQQGMVYLPYLNQWKKVFNKLLYRNMKM